MENIVKFESLGLTFNINRTAFSIFGLNVYWYGIIIAFGLMVAFIYALKESEKLGIAQDDLLNLFIIGLPSAIVGARLYYVIFSFDDYRDNLLEIFNIRGGGIAIYGAIIGAFLAVFLYCRKKRIDLLKILDILAVGFLIGQSIGRWGNFVNGEAFGGNTSALFAMTIIKNGKTIAQNVHPTFLYESVWNLLGLIFLLIYKRKQVFKGELFSLYMLWYGLGRFLIEGLRTDSLYIGPFRVSQVLSLILLSLGTYITIAGRKKVKSKKE